VTSREGSPWWRQAWGAPEFLVDLDPAFQRHAGSVTGAFCAFLAIIGIATAHLGLGFGWLMSAVLGLAFGLASFVKMRRHLNY
jgi:type IV secretory pathway VirB2 component (pilin)